MVKTHLNLSYSCEINVCVKYNNQTLLSNGLFKFSLINYKLNQSTFLKNGTEMDITPRGSISVLVWTIFTRSKTCCEVKAHKTK